MAIVHPDEHIVSVFANTSGGITISQIKKEHGEDTCITVDIADIHNLVHALQIVKREIENASA